MVVMRECGSGGGCSPVEVVWQWWWSTGGSVGTPVV